MKNAAGHLTSRASVEDLLALVKKKNQNLSRISNFSTEHYRHAAIKAYLGPYQTPKI